MENKKSQTAIEFVILVGFLLFAFTVFFLAIQENMSDKIRERQNLAVKEIALIVQDEINFALESSDGYFRKFELPDKVGSRDYDVTLIGGMVYIKTQDDEHAIALPIANATGVIQKGVNTIKKENGEIKLNA